MIVTQKLNKKFGKLNAINDLSLNVGKGTIHGLIGPEGSGKSTVLRILSTLIRPDSGTATVNGIPLSRGTQLRKIIGLVPEKPRFPPGTTAYGMVSFAASMRGINDKGAIAIALKKTGLDALANQTTDHFSDSMRKNLAFAMAIVHDPEILLVDEISGLDPVSMRLFKEYVLSSKKTVLITGQELDTIEDICDGVSVLRRGSLVVEDTISSLRQKIGKGILEIKLAEAGSVQKLLFEFEKRRINATASSGSIYINFNNDSEIPGIIRMAADTAEVKEAKAVNVSIEDIFKRYSAEQG